MEPTEVRMIGMMKPWWMQAARGYLSGWKNGLQQRRGIRVLFYHGVVERKKDVRLERNFHLLFEFKEHLRFLRFFRVLSADELLDVWTNQKDHGKPAVVITFDDGYANNLIAAELLDKYRIPWILFVSTGAMNREGKPLWAEELSLLLLHGRAQRVEALGKVWSLTTREEREIAFQEIRYPMKRLPAPQRRQVMEEIRQQFPEGETQRLLEQFPSLQMLTWEEVQQLASAGVEIGSHGVEHEIHHPNQLEVVRREELVFSKKEIERRLNRPCRYFAYPNGDFIESSPKEVQEAGYLMAFTTQQRAVLPNDDPYLLPRIGARGSLHNFVREFFWDSKKVSS